MPGLAVPSWAAAGYADPSSGWGTPYPYQPSYYAYGYSPSYSPYNPVPTGYDPNAYSPRDPYQNWFRTSAGLNAGLTATPFSSTMSADPGFGVAGQGPTPSSMPIAPGGYNPTAFVQPPAGGGGRSAGAAAAGGAPAALGAGAAGTLPNLNTGLFGPTAAPFWLQAAAAMGQPGDLGHNLLSAMGAFAPWAQQQSMRAQNVAAVRAATAGGLITPAQAAIMTYMQPEMAAQELASQAFIPPATAQELTIRRNEAATSEAARQQQMALQIFQAKRSQWQYNDMMTNGNAGPPPEFPDLESITPDSVMQKMLGGQRGQPLAGTFTSQLQGGPTGATVAPSGGAGVGPSSPALGGTQSGGQGAGPAATIAPTAPPVSTPAVPPSPQPLPPATTTVRRSPSGLMALGMTQAGDTGVDQFGNPTPQIPTSMFQGNPIGRQALGMTMMGMNPRAVAAMPAFKAAGAYDVKTAEGRAALEQDMREARQNNAIRQKVFDAFEQDLDAAYKENPAALEASVGPNMGYPESPWAARAAGIGNVVTGALNLLPIPTGRAGGVGNVAGNITDQYIGIPGGLNAVSGMTTRMRHAVSAAISHMPSGAAGTLTDKARGFTEGQLNEILQAPSYAQMKQMLGTARTMSASAAGEDQPQTSIQTGQAPAAYDFNNADEKRNVGGTTYYRFGNRWITRPR
jgi:hypothetical protein